MADKIIRLCGKLLETEDYKDAVQPVGAELQHAICDRIETVRQHFVDIALIAASANWTTFLGSLGTK